MKIFKLTILVFSLVFLILPILVGAQGWQRIESKYLFHLQFDNGKLSIDRSYEYPYDVIPEPANIAENLYKAEVLNFLNQVATTVYFDPQHGDPNFKKGNIIIEIPYTADGKEVNFYNPEGKKLLTISVAETSFCDDDGICDEEFGEDYRNCSNDCKETVLPSSSISPEPVYEAADKSYLIWIILGSGIFIVLAIYLFRWFKTRKKNQSDPPVLPPSSPKIGLPQ